MAILTVIKAYHAIRFLKKQFTCVVGLNPMGSNLFLEDNGCYEDHWSLMKVNGCF
jgi:hypothetical protein